MVEKTPSSNPLADELFRGSDEISIETVKALMLPQEPRLQALINEYERRTADGENLVIYYGEGSIWMGPR